MAHVSHKLKGALQGALAGGGDPATSPLYVFGPFLALIVGAGVAPITMGASIWLVVLTVVMVSLMYRLVMVWVVDGSGGSGLNEEEFGPWAVKLSAAITFVEYTLTFLVSMAALVTFLADRIPALGGALLGVPIRSLVAVVLSVLTGFLVNRGPRAAARAFGPATAAVLLLLWAMIIATIWKRGFHLPRLDFAAFHHSNLHFTLAGYTRLLALMTGIEIFANLVAAYDGTPREKSRMAFRSLLIIMGTTCLTMLVVGPAILDLSNPFNASTSVFTQTMDRLLPMPLPYLGSLVGIAVLLSACAASAQGLQNLALGLRYRHYIPATLGQRNRFDVADQPVWLEVAIACLCFLLVGTHEELYLSVYAVGVFILLSLTGWASVKRLGRHFRLERRWVLMLGLVGTALAAALTSLATGLIFVERFKEGAWTYFVMIPALFWAFGHIRRRLGEPTPVENRLGVLFSEQKYLSLPVAMPSAAVSLKTILAPLDSTIGGEQALRYARRLSRVYGARLVLAGIPEARKDSLRPDMGEYLSTLHEELTADDLDATTHLESAPTPGQAVARAAEAVKADLVVWSSATPTEVLTEALNAGLDVPVLMMTDASDWHSRQPGFGQLLVGLDGSAEAEHILPLAASLAKRFDSRMTLLSVPEGSESEGYHDTITRYLAGVEATLHDDGVKARSLVAGSGPAMALLETVEAELPDLVVVTTHGRGGLAASRAVRLGSVAETLLRKSPRPVLIAPLQAEG